MKDQDGWSLLWWAVQLGHNDVVKLLLKPGKVDTDSKYKNGRTPLFWVAEKGHYAVLKLLLGKGADLESKDEIAGPRSRGLQRTGTRLSSSFCSVRMPIWSRRTKIAGRRSRGLQRTGTRPSSSCCSIRVLAMSLKTMRRQYSRATTSGGAVRARGY